MNSHVDDVSGQRFSLIVELIKKDRDVIDSLIERINRILQWFLLASFAVTAYLIRPTIDRQECSIHLVLAAAVSVLCFFFLSLAFSGFMLREVRFLRRNMEMREDILRAYLAEGHFGEDDNPFAVAECRALRIQDHGLLCTIGVVSFIYIMKLVMILFLVCMTR